MPMTSTVRAQRQHKENILLQEIVTPASSRTEIANWNEGNWYEICTVSYNEDKKGKENTKKKKCEDQLKLLIDSKSEAHMASTKF